MEPVCIVQARKNVKRWTYERNILDARLDNKVWTDEDGIEHRGYTASMRGWQKGYVQYRLANAESTLKALEAAQVKGIALV